MAKHYNSSITERGLRILNSKQGDFLPDEVSGPVATIELKPVCRISRSAVATNAANVTIYTTPTDKDFYLTAAQLSVIKDATATSAGSYIQATIDGVAQILIIITGLTLTAQSDAVSQSWPFALKIDRGTPIIVTGTTTTANVKSYGTIQGYTEEVTRT